MPRPTRLHLAALSARLIVNDLRDVAWTRLTREGRRARRAHPRYSGDAYTGWTATGWVGPPPTTFGTSWFDAMAPFVSDDRGDPLLPLPFNVKDSRREIEDAHVARVYAEASKLDPWPGSWPADPDDERLERFVSGVAEIPNLPSQEEAVAALSAAYRALAEEGTGLTGPALEYAAWNRLTHAERWALDRARYLDEENNR